MLSRGLGVIYLDKQSNILACNELAKKIFQRMDGIMTRAGKLCFCDSGARNDFIEKIDSLLPFVDTWYKETDKPHSLVLISEPKRDFLFPEWVFKNYYELTKAELAVARAVFEDTALQEYAAQKGVKITTVRWTLDNVFSKTHTHSQKELKTLALQYID